MTDVSCRALGIVLDALDGRGIPVATLIQDLDVDLTALRDRRCWIRWEQFVAIMDRFGALIGDPDELEVIGRTFLAHPTVANAGAVLGLLASPAAVFRFNNRWTGPSIFPAIVPSLERIGPNRLEIVLSIPDDLADCPEFYYLTKGAFHTLPRLIGCRPARVEMELVPRRGTYRIDLPPSRSLAARLGRLIQRLAAGDRVNAELARQQDELGLILDRQQSTQRRLERLFAGFPDPILRVDAAGEILEVHVPSGFTAAVDPTQWRGNAVELARLVVPADRRDELDRWWDAVRAGGPVDPVSFPLTLPSGERKHREVRTIRLGGGECAFVMRDITAQVEMEDRRLRAAEAEARAAAAEQAGAELSAEVEQRRVLEARLDGAARAATTLLQAPAVDGALPELLAIIGEAFGADRSYVWKRGISPAADDGAVGILQHQWCRDDTPPKPSRREALAEPNPIMEAFRAGQPFVRHAGDAESDLERKLAEHGIASLLLLPLAADDEIWGCLGLESCRHPRRWSPAEVSLLTALAGSLAAALSREAATEALRQAKDEAERASRAKDTILRNVSHEIRTPMTAILGFAELLGQNLSGTPQAVHAEMIERSGKRLLRLLNNILDLARLEAGGVTVRREPVILSTCVATVVELFSALAERKGLTVEVLVPGDLAVAADAMHLEQVFANILANAIQYTKMGSIQIGARAADGRAAIHVSDTGIGIPPHFQPYLFDAFRRGHEGDGLASPGSGLGLAIARRLLTEMDGRIRIESAAGEGTTVTVELPLA